MTYIGIDVGSTYTKYFIFAANKIKIFTEYTPVRQHEYFEKKLCAFYNHYCDCKIVSCGYGKRNVKSVKSVTELTALATGLNAQCPQINIALDIGGQDTKIIRQQDGNLKDFFINDKCAAGSGLFLINTLNILDMVFDDIDLAACTSDVKLSTTCAVFAQSEIVELIADGVSPEKIVAATLRQIFLQAKTLLNKLDCGDTMVLSGGLTKIKGIRDFAETYLEKHIIIPDMSSYLSAMGCAIIAKEI